MKTTLSTRDVADALRDDENAGWSWGAAHAIAEYLEQLEDDTGEEMELDVVAIRCDFNEHASALEAVQEYNYEADDDDNDDTKEEKAREWLRDRTQVIEFDGGIVIQAF